MKTENPGFFSFLDHFTFVEDDSSSYEIGISDDGFSYLDLVSEKKARQISFAEKQRRGTSAALDGSTRARGRLNIRKVEKIDHDAISLDTNLEEIIRDIQERKKRIPFFPIGLGIFAILFLLWCFVPDWVAKILLGIWLFPIGFLALWNLWKLDVSRRHASLTYRFSGSGLAAFQNINASLGRLAECQQVLLLTGFRHFEDTRYSGGAAKMPEFKLTKLNRRAPPLIDLDSSVWHVRADRRDLYFMPDHVMIYDGANIGGITYSTLELQSLLDSTQARDTAKRTTDCKIVGTTHRFVNNDGSPDQRFNNNIEIPIIEYGVFRLSGSGLDMRLYASNQNAGTSAANGFGAMKTLASKPVVPMADTRRKSSAAKPPRRVDVFEALLNAMCCVMACDGRISRIEKTQMQEVLERVKAPLTPNQVSDHVSTFCESIKRDGFSSVVNSACEDVKVFNNTKKADILLSSLESIATADGTIHESERKIIHRFRTAVRSSA